MESYALIGIYAPEFSFQSLTLIQMMVASGAPVTKDHLWSCVGG
jgi:hypothetical protein